MSGQPDNQPPGGDRFAWAGPMLFIAVSLAFAVFFWWFVQA